METKTTEELKHEIRAATDIEDYLAENKENLLNVSLAGHLNALLAHKGLKRADVVHRSELSRTYVYKIFSGEKVPSRDKLLAIAFGLGLSEEETQKMLKLSGSRELYARDPRDVLILFALQRGKPILEANEMLDSHGLAILSTGRE